MIGIASGESLSEDFTRPASPHGGRRLLPIYLPTEPKTDVLSYANGPLLFFDKVRALADGVLSTSEPGSCLGHPAKSLAQPEKPKRRSERAGHAHRDDRGGSLCSSRCPPL